MKISVAIAASLLLVGGTSTMALAQVGVGQPAPGYLGKSGDGKPIDLANYRGKVVIASFWASWCGPCMQELPYLEGLQKVLGPEKVKVIAISIEDRDTYRRIRRAAYDMQMEFVHDSDGTVSKTYGRKGVPHLIVVSKDGTLLRQFIGYSEKQIDAIIAEVQEALKE